MKGKSRQIQLGKQRKSFTSSEIKAMQKYDEEISELCAKVDKESTEATEEAWRITEEWCKSGCPEVFPEKKQN